MSLSDLKDLAKKVVRQECKNDILKVYPIEKQISASIGAYEQSKRTTIKDFVKDKVNACNTKESEIDACTTEKQLKDLWKTYFSDVPEDNATTSSFRNALGSLD